MKYASLKALAKALRTGKEPKAYCTFDKEFVAITSNKTSYPGGDDEPESDDFRGELLFECAEDEFIWEAFRALGIRAQGA